MKRNSTFTFLLSVIASDDLDNVWNMYIGVKRYYFNDLIQTLITSIIEAGSNVSSFKLTQEEGSLSVCASCVYLKDNNIRMTLCKIQ